MEYYSLVVFHCLEFYDVRLAAAGGVGGVEDEDAFHAARILALAEAAPKFQVQYPRSFPRNSPLSAYSFIEETEYADENRSRGKSRGYGKATSYNSMNLPLRTQFDASVVTNAVNRTIASSSPPAGIDSFISVSRTMRCLAIDSTTGWRAPVQ